MLNSILIVKHNIDYDLNRNIFFFFSYLVDCLNRFTELTENIFLLLQILNFRKFN